MQISEINFNDQHFPDRLREIPSPPKQLYLLGELPNDPCVAIVGTRRKSDYGEMVTYQLAGELAAAGVTIISGMAYGLDTTAHRAALDADGRTVAVLAGGLDVISPAGNRGLAQEILDNGGGLISEQAQGSTMHKGHFVSRNRLISGLSQAVIITEAPEGSGALLTANFGLNQNRSVMAVPGNITSFGSTGPNNLIRRGAVPISNAQDVLTELNLAFSNPTIEAVAKSQEEATILELLAKGHNSSEQLIRASQFDAAKFANVITLMEITGKVRNLGAGNWVAR